MLRCVNCRANRDIGKLCRRCYYKQYYQNNKHRYGENTRKPQRVSKKIAFIKSILKTKSQDCIKFPFACDSKGYGTVFYKGKTYGAHRFVCRIVHGKPPNKYDYVAAHSCGNGHLGCINPNHLSWKTYAENNFDKILHDTHGVSLSNTQVSQILQLISLGFVKQKHIAQMYSCSTATVSLIKKKKIWKHIKRAA